MNNDAYQVRVIKGQYNQNENNYGIENLSFNPEGGVERTGARQNSSPRNGGVTNAVVANVAKKAIQYGISQYGNLTGDYVTQANISAMIEIGGLVAMAATGPVGIAAAVTSLGIQAANYGIDMAKKRRETEFLRERTGMTQNSGGRR